MMESECHQEYWLCLVTPCLAWEDDKLELNRTYRIITHCSTVWQHRLVGSPCSPRDSQESSPTPQFKSINSSVLSFLYGPALTSIHDSGKNIALTRWTFVGKVISLLFNMLSRFFIAFLPRIKRLLISWLQSLSAVILEPPKIKCVTVSIVSLCICHEVMGLDAWS